jgi:hypothetical protein
MSLLAIHICATGTRLLRSAPVVRIREQTLRGLFSLASGFEYARDSASAGPRSFRHPD